MRNLHIFELLILGLISLSAHAGNILVEVTGLKPQQGQVICSLFDGEKTFLKSPMQSQTKTVEKANSVEVKFEKVIPATYGITCVHDKNSDGELDRNFMGMPAEAVGASNNAKSLFGPPKYKDAKFEVSEEEPDLKLQIKVDYVF